jgi:hypothetical protein
MRGLKCTVEEMKIADFLMGILKNLVMVCLFPWLMYRHLYLVILGSKPVIKSVERGDPPSQGSSSFGGLLFKPDIHAVCPSLPREGIFSQRAQKTSGVK